MRPAVANMAMLNNPQELSAAAAVTPATRNTPLIGAFR
jgi:hypothetical protein